MKQLTFSLIELYSCETHLVKSGSSHFEYMSQYLFAFPKMKMSIFNKHLDEDEMDIITPKIVRLRSLLTWECWGRISLRIPTII